MVEIPLNVISAAQASQHATGIPSSVTLAQWAVESAWGARCTGTFNVFGIKAVGDESFTMCWTHEDSGGQSVKAQAHFANYASLEDAFTAHAKLLADEPQFAHARTSLPDAVAFTKAMAPVYATDPGYSALLLKIIQEHNLTQYDMVPA